MEKNLAIIEGLKMGYKERVSSEKLLYQQYNYFINEGCRKYRLSYEDSFSAYSDAILSVIHNIVSGRFENKATLKTYLFRVFSNKCIDLVRNNSINKQRVHQGTTNPDLLSALPDKAKTAVEVLIDRYKESAILEYLGTIGEKCKEILLYFEDGYTDKEIAERLAYNSAAVVKTTRNRCLDKLREKMNHLLKIS
ncbi:MAG TPA: sigma-70 family RNA polymerase sigma factor [Puia sp.]|nr:sigma-70 family RNA polymerase sigma factor [Puia sp.]